MSGAMESRAAVFTSQPQAVEVYQSGGWWPGELLGWRHDSNGACQVWVRVVLGGVEETAWTDLATLRLPERHLSVAPENRVPATQAMVAPVRSSAGRASESAVQQQSAASRPGGRRRAPDGDEVVALASRPAVPPPGRHRAPADPGRHRVADTGMVPPVPASGRYTGSPAGSTASPTESTAALEMESRPRSGGRRRAPDTGAMAAVPGSRQARAAESRVRPPAGAAPVEVEPEMLTRPMRLSDHVPHARRPQLNGSLSKA